MLFNKTFDRKITSAKMQKIYSEITIATFMQPFQSDIRCSAAKDNSVTHAAVVPRNLDAAIAMRFATSRRKPACLYAHGNTTWQHNMATQHGNIHAAIPLQSATRDSRSAKTYAHDEPLIAEHRGGTNRAWNDRSRNRRTHKVPFHRRLQPLHTEKHKGSCPGSLPKRNPCNMQPLQCVLQHHDANPHVYTHMATQHGNISCSHPTANCNPRFQNTLKLRAHTQTQPKQIEATTTVPESNNIKMIGPDPPHTRRGTVASSGAAALHGKMHGFLPWLSPKTKPM